MCVGGEITFGAAGCKVQRFSFFSFFLMHSVELKKSFARQPSPVSADQHGQKPLRLISSLISLETREVGGSEQSGETKVEARIWRTALLFLQTVGDFWILQCI